MYYPGDQYCVVKMRLFPELYAVVLRHELIHALSLRTLAEDPASRMVDEGLAEYLQLCRPGDRGLAVPTIRLAHNLALLQQRINALSSWGVRLDSLKPARLASLTPKQFYALRGLGYPLAQAAMAFIGNEVIEEAFARKSRRPIIAAVEAIDWMEFLEWVKKNAARGSPEKALIVEDAPPEAASFEDSAEEPKVFRGALESLGVKIEDGAGLRPQELSLVPGERFRDEDLVLQVLKEIIAAAEGPVLLADLSPALRRGFLPRRGSPALSALFGRSSPGASSRLDFVKSFGDALGAARGGSACLLAGLSAPPRIVAAAEVDPRSRFTAEAVPGWLSDLNRGPLDLVIFVAVTDEVARDAVRAQLAGVRFTEEDVRAALAEHYRQTFAARALPIRNALIVDLSGGEGDALPLARGIAASQDHRGAVAYWDPQAAPRDSGAPAADPTEE